LVSAPAAGSPGSEPGSPSWAATGSARRRPQLFWKVLAPLARPFMRSPERGAATPIYLASSPEVHAVTGAYFVNRKPKSSSKASYDTPAAARLWRVSADLVGLAPDNG
jgi:retinol dehydrogenase 14